MNYAEITRLLLIVFVTSFVLTSLVVYVLLDFLFRWKKIGIRKISYRIIVALLCGLLLTLLYFYILSL